MPDLESSEGPCWANNDMCWIHLTSGGNLTTQAMVSSVCIRAQMSTMRNGLSGH